MARPILAFQNTLKKHAVSLDRLPLEIVQVNLGKLCNQACLHCHVEAGPKRSELMSLEAVKRIIELLSQAKDVHTLDITGGAPEMNPHFRHLAKHGRNLGLEVIDRCNLTIFFEEGYQDLPQFLSENQITVIASLPCYSKDNVDQQRGSGVFEKSINALRALNELGYASKDTLKLHLVYNPLGAALPPSQESLEKEYKQRLKQDFGIEFNQLFTITNMPIKRFLHQLKRDGEYEQYMQLLLDNFNPQAAHGVMCRNLISIGWDGELYDCDFNQMLELPLGKKTQNIWDIESFDELSQEAIALGSHCYGCTAGSGSSCSGTLT